MDARRNSHWLNEAIAPDEEACPSLHGDINADICIVGGGFTGLWTALSLKQQEPTLDIVILEKDVCGAGASGRNAGYVLSWWAKFASLEKICGGEEAVRLAAASAAAVDAIGDFCRHEGIDAHYRRDGWLWAATSDQQVGSWNGTVEAAERYQQHPFERWSPREVVARSGTTRYQAGIFEPGAASVQPAALARGLRQSALARGVRIFENTPLTKLKNAAKPEVITPKGRVKAAKLVLAMNAWGIRFAAIRRAIAVVSSDMIISEAMPERLEEIGLPDGLLITDSRMLINAQRTTRDGRIAFCKGGMSGSLPYGGNLGAKLDGPSPLREGVISWLAWTYPKLGRVRPASSWRGPIDRSKDGLPYFGALEGRPNVFHAVGYSGNGVGPSYLGGKILASLALEKKDEWSGCGLVRPLGRDFPPEPIRYFGARLVRRALARSDAAADKGRTPGPLTRYLAGFAPAGLSPFKGQKT
ncbi:MAG TPA: FAD-binding oxidoreductase [Alphaproteobacteria bacterium]|nr:FAD-binding oxidoreductase [Alphaproteobacteria bacterium]